jgi:prevent-host-death family protein
MNSKSISAMEARKRFGEIMNRVALRGESFTIARAGKPLVRIVPVAPIEDGVFENPFNTFSEWDDKSNDVYDSL